MFSYGSVRIIWHQEEKKKKNDARPEISTSALTRAVCSGGILFRTIIKKIAKSGTVQK